MALKDKYNFISCWEGSLHGIKGCLMNKETGKLRPVKGPKGKKMYMFYADRDMLKRMGIKILRGKKRTGFLQLHGWTLDRESRVIKRRKK